MMWRTDLENIPEYPVEVLVWHRKGFASVTVKGSGDFDHDEARPEPITHWMPLPDPPPPSQSDAATKSCNEVPPGNGYCDMCAAGHYEKCRYVHNTFDAEAER